MIEPGILIRELRIAQGIGLNEFSDMVDMDSANLSRFERGGGGIKLPESLYPMAKVLKTTVPAIFLLLEKAEADPSLLESKARLAQLLARVNTALAKI